jgi:hypothetical protein
VPDAPVAEEPVDAVLPEPLPNPSALRAWNSECMKLCTCCVGLVAAAAVAAVAAAVVPPAEAEDTPVAAAVPAVALAEVTVGMPMTCSRVCIRLVNSPWVVVGVDELLELLEPLELLELDSKAAELCAPFL